MPVLRVGATSLELSVASPAIIFGHADADGHVAAEQTRTNLHSQGIEVNDVVISPETRNHRFWKQTFPNLDFSPFRLVVAVDIAFNFRNPGTSLQPLLQTVDRHSSTHFVVVDHHPLEPPDEDRTNLSLVQVDTAYECCLGTPSDELMVVAAICDGDGKTVRSRTTPDLLKRAIGVRRAAADLNGMAGAKLLALLRRRQWDFFEDLANEPVEYHRNVRGRRTANSLMSPLLEAARNGAI